MEINNKKTRMEVLLCFYYSRLNPELLNLHTIDILSLVIICKGVGGGVGWFPLHYYRMSSSIPDLY